MKYKVIVQNHDVAGSEMKDIEFIAGSKGLIQIQPGKEIIISEIVYDILNNNKQTRYREDGTSYVHRRFPMTLLEKIPENDKDRKKLKAELSAKIQEDALEGKESEEIVEATA